MGASNLYVKLLGQICGGIVAKEFTKLVQTNPCLVFSVRFDQKTCPDFWPKVDTIVLMGFWSQQKQNPTKNLGNVLTDIFLPGS